MTEAERRLWQILRSHQMKGYKFRRQMPIGRYIADFVCHEARLIVEIDGGQHDRSSPRPRFWCTARTWRRIISSSGCREDLLRRVDGAWKVRRRTIVLDANVLLDKNLSVFL
jgi:hypothetical protein